MENLLRKKLLYRSLHRGCKETDLIFGSFAQKNIESMSLEELHQFDEILSQTDSDIVSWVMKRSNPPQELLTPLMKRLLS